MVYIFHFAFLHNNKKQKRYKNKKNSIGFKRVNLGILKNKFFFNLYKGF